MNTKLFEKQIYEKGRKYYQNHQVNKFKKIGNNYITQVLGSSYHQVVIEVNRNKKIIKMTCDCQKGKQGIKCEHEAAACISLREKNIINPDFALVQSKEQSLQELFKSITSQSRSDIYLHNRFIDEIYYRISRYEKNSRYNGSSLIEDIDFMYNDFLKIKYPERFKRGITDIFYDRIESYIYQYPKDILEWSIQSLILGRNFDFLSIMFQIIELQNESDKKAICLDILTTKKYKNKTIDNRLLIIYYQTANSTEKNKAYQLLQKYNNLEGYIYIKSDFLLSQNKGQEAKNMLEDFSMKYQISNENIYRDLLFNVYAQLKDINMCKEFIYKYFDQQNIEENITYINRLKELYADLWDTQKVSFYNQLKEIVKVRDFKLVINRNNEWKYAIQCVSDNICFTELNRYEKIIKENDLDMYIYLYSLCLYKEVAELSSYTQYEHIIERLNFLESIGCNKDGMIEITFTIKKEFPNKKSLIKRIDDYLYLKV